MLGSSPRATANRGTTWLLLALLAMLFTACGSRLPDEVLTQIDDRTLRGADGGNGLAAGSNDGDGASTDGGFSGDEIAGGGDGGDGGSDDGGVATDGGATDGGDDGGEAVRSNGSCRGGATDKGVTEREIKVAGMVTASGPLPGATEGAYRGAAAYFAKVNAEGGVCGRKITILKGDDGLDPQRARGEFLRLEPQVLAFVGNLAVADSGYIDLIEKTGVPYVGTTVDPSGRTLPNALPKTLVGYANTGPFLYYRRHYPDVKRVGFLFSDVGGVRANTPASREPIKKVGFDIVYDSGAQVTSPDYTAEIINMRQNDVEMLYLFAVEVNMHVRLARNMRQQNWEPELKVSQIGYNSKLTELLGGVANEWSNHITYVPMLNADEPARSPELRVFLDWNRRVFPGGQIDLFPVGGWGDADLFVDALRKLGPNVTRAGIISAINSFGKGTWGIEAPIDTKTGLASTCFVIARVENAKWVREYPKSGYECGLGQNFKYD